MKIQEFRDTAIEDIAKANVDAFFADLAADPQQKESKKNLEDFRKSADTEHVFRQFEEDLQLGRAGAPGPRLRSERADDPEIVWRPGDDPSTGLEPGELYKRYRGSEPARIEKLENGWVKEYDASGNLLRAYAPEVDAEQAFAR